MELEQQLKKVQAETQKERQEKEKNLQKYQASYKEFEHQIQTGQKVLEKENGERA